MADAVDRLERDAVLVGQLARTVEHLGISRAVEALVAVEHELRALAIERRATGQAASDAARGFEALRVELASVKTQLADVMAVLRTFRR